MNLNEIIKSTLGLEDYSLYLEDTEFSLADLSFEESELAIETAKEIYEVDQLDYNSKEELFKDNPALEEIQYFIDDIEEDEEIDLYEFLN